MFQGSFSIAHEARLSRKCSVFMRSISIGLGFMSISILDAFLLKVTNLDLLCLNE